MATKHGMRNTVEYRIWVGIKRRCTNPNVYEYPRYGGAGITMHHAWADSFIAFFNYVGKRPEGMQSLDRIDNTKGYTPDNVRWATSKQQANNRKNNVVLIRDGVYKTMAEWADELGISYETIQWRVKRGKDPFAPITKRYSRNMKNKLTGVNK